MEKKKLKCKCSAASYGKVFFFFFSTPESVQQTAVCHIDILLAFHFLIHTDISERSGQKGERGNLLKSGQQLFLT